MPIEQSQCPFCGTSVGAGFDVCAGCGARYDTPISTGQSWKRLFIIIGFLPAFIVAFLTAFLSHSNLLGVGIMFAYLVLAVKTITRAPAGKPLWIRQQ